METTGFGIIGVGLIASFHVKALNDIPGTGITACYDISPERSKAFAEEHHCSSKETLEELLSDKEVDTVIICTPSGLHLEPALAAAAAGKNLVIEKPLEITTRRCDQIIDAAEKNNVRLTGIFPSRFSDAAERIKKAIDAGRFGKLTLLDAAVKWHRSEEYYAQAGWRGTWKLDGGGTLMNQSIHAVDLLQWFSGGISEVSAYTGTLGHKDLEVEDVAAASVLYNVGALGTISCTTASWPGWAKRIEISGTGGSAVLEDDFITRWDFEKTESEDEPIKEAIKSREAKSDGDGGAGDPAAINYEGHRRQLADFTAALRENRDPLINGPEARKAVAAITAIYRSAETGQRVKV